MQNDLLVIVAGSFVGAIAAIIVVVKFMATHGFIRKSLAEVVKEMRDRGEL